MKKNKSLQKITKLNSVTELNNYIELHPTEKEEVCNSIQKRIGAVYSGESDEDDSKLIQMLISLVEDEPTRTDIKNVTFETNHALITSFIHNHLLKHRQFPTITSMAQGLNISRTTIYRHLENGILHSNNTLVKHKNELMISSALQQLYLIGIEDRNPTALKNYVKLLQNATNTNITNNYIQINNLKISTDKIQNLPMDDLMQIEAIIQKTISN
jgi:DNA-binding transcriptional regulator YhcF (GntR family)